MANIFICGDTGQTPLLAAVETTLRGLGHEVIRGPLDIPGTVRQYSYQERAELLNNADVAVFTVRHLCSRELMADASQLRGICYPTIGVETLDLSAANDLGLIVGYGAVRENVIGMAESTLMLMLMLLYRVQTNIDLMREGKWRHAKEISRQIEGKTVGILGFGRIGRALAERLQPFGAKILACSPRLPQDQMPPGIAKVDLPELLSRSDLLAVLTGLTPETRHMIGPAELSRMKPDAFIINTGRGAVFDEEALFAALRDRTIAGAALDTFSVEPLPSDSPLRTLDNVILTPHAVGHTIEGGDAFHPAMVQNILRMLKGELPLYCKNPEIEPLWRERLKGL